MADENTEEQTAGIGHNNPPIEELLAVEFEKHVLRIEALLLDTAKITVIDSDDDVANAIEVGKRINTAIGVNDEKRTNRTLELRETVKKINAWFAKLDERPVAEKERIIDRINDFKKRKREAEAKLAAERAERAAEEARIRRESAKEAGGVVGEVLNKEADRRDQESTMAREHAVNGVGGNLKTSAGSASDRTTIKHRIVDWKKIPYAKLKGHIKTEHLDAAIRSYTAAHKKVDKNTLPELSGVEFFYDTNTVLR